MVFIPTSSPQYKSLPNIDIQDRSTLQDLFENILGDDYENIDISMDEEYDEDDNTTEVIEIGCDDYYGNRVRFTYTQSNDPDDALL